MYSFALLLSLGVKPIIIGTKLLFALCPLVIGFTLEPVVKIPESVSGKTEICGDVDGNKGDLYTIDLPYMSQLDVIVERVSEVNRVAHYNVILSEVGIVCGICLDDIKAFVGNCDDITAKEIIGVDFHNVVIFNVLICLTDEIFNIN